MFKAVKHYFWLVKETHQCTLGDIFSLHRNQFLFILKNIDDPLIMSPLRTKGDILL
jgi:hypothetical protein